VRAPVRGSHLSRSASEAAASWTRRWLRPPHSGPVQRVAPVRVFGTTLTLARRALTGAVKCTPECSDSTGAAAVAPMCAAVAADQLPPHPPCGGGPGLSYGTAPPSYRPRPSATAALPSVTKPTETPCRTTSGRYRRAVWPYRTTFGAFCEVAGVPPPQSECHGGTRVSYGTTEERYRGTEVCHGGSERRAVAPARATAAQPRRAVRPRPAAAAHGRRTVPRPRHAVA
jgi:hypothetical protein